MRISVTALALAVMFSGAVSSARGLTVGDPAPPLSAGSWVKGEPVKGFEKGKVYVVDFWATWCGPCVASIPHLTDLAQKHPEVTVIGMNVGETEEKIGEFVKKTGEKMGFRVAMDDRSKQERGATVVGWLDASKHAGIPASFIVGREGTIEWIGHPQKMDGPLKDVIAGTLDREAAKRKFEALRASLEKRRAIEDDMQAAIRPAMEKKDYAGAMKALDEWVGKTPEEAQYAGWTRVDIGIAWKNWDVVYASMDFLAAVSGRNPHTLASLAQVIVEAPGMDQRDLERAEKYVEEGLSKAREEEPKMLTIAAEVYAARGKWEKAITMQEKVVKGASGAEKETAEKMLRAYREKQRP